MTITSEVPQAPRDTATETIDKPKPKRPLGQIIIGWALEKIRPRGASQEQALHEKREGLTREQITTIVTAMERAKTRTELETQRRIAYFDVASTVYDTSLANNQEEKGIFIGQLKRRLILEEVFEATVKSMIPHDLNPVDKTLLSLDFANMFYLTVGGRLDEQFAAKPRPNNLDLLSVKATIAREYLDTARASCREKELAEAASGIPTAVKGLEWERVNYVEHQVAESQEEDQQDETFLNLRTRLRDKNLTGRKLDAVKNYSPVTSLFAELGIIQEDKHEETPYIRELVSLPAASPYTHKYIIDAITHTGGFQLVNTHDSQASMFHLTYTDERGNITLDESNVETMVPYLMHMSLGSIFYANFTPKTIEYVKEQKPGKRTITSEKYPKKSHLLSGHQVLFPFHRLRHITKHTGFRAYPKELPTTAVETRLVTLKDIRDFDRVTTFDHFAHYGIMAEAMLQKAGLDGMVSLNPNVIKLATAWTSLREAWETQLETLGIEIPDRSTWHTKDTGANMSTGYAHLVDIFRMKKQEDSTEFRVFQERLTREIAQYIQTARGIFGFS